MTKQKIRFIFFHGKDSFIGKTIIRWTFILAVVRLDFKSLKYNYSHVEEWEPDEIGDFQIRTWMERPGQRMPFVGWTGECFSSTTRGNSKGVRFAPASEVLKHPERWDYIEVEVEESEVKSLTKLRLNDMVGLKYDFLGVIAGFTLPINIQDSKKWYSSEICAFIAWHLDILFKLYSRISPRRFAKVLAKKYGEPKRLVDK